MRAQQVVEVDAGPKKLYVTYDHIHALVEKHAAALRNFKPDVIIAVGGGGFVPGRIVREHVKAKMIGVVLEHYNDANGEKSDAEPKKVQWIDSNSEALVKGKRVLIVDEIDDTRETMAYLVKELQTLSPAATGVFVLHNKLRKKSSDFTVPIAYLAGEEIPDVWVVYPWEAANYSTHAEMARKQDEAS